MEDEVVRTMIWSETAARQLEDAYSFITKRSVANAEKVVRSIIAATAKLPKHPTMHPADKYKNNNDGTFRAFTVLNYRVSYQITDREIVIVRLRYSGRKPLEY